jgi:sulfoquinovosidase
MNRRYLSFLLGVLTLFFTVKALSASGRIIKPGSLYSKIPSVHYAIGSYHWNWDAEARQISVSHLTDSLHVLWSSIPGKSFVAAAVGQGYFEDKRGTFILHEKIGKEVYNEACLQSISIQDDQLELILALEGAGSRSLQARVVWKVSAEGHLQWEVDCDKPVNRLFGFWAKQAQDYIIGMGEQPSNFNHNGNWVPVLVQEQGIGRGDIQSLPIKLGLGASTGNAYTTYKAVPHFMSSSGQSAYLRNTTYSEFDFRAPDYLGIKVFDRTLSVNILPGKTPADFVTAYTAYAGRMRRLPEWVHSGAIVGMQGGTEKVRDVWQKLRNAETPIAAFWLQDWVGQRKTILGQQLWWNWELDHDRYPHWTDLVKEFQAEGVSVMGYINPFLVEVEGQKPNYRRNLYQEALDSGFLVLNEKGKPYLNVTSFKAALLDLSHPGCRSWIKSLIKSELIEQGFRGWMADFGEALPFDVRLNNATSTAAYHNLYPQEWAQINREAIEEAGLGDDLTFFSRAAFTRSPTFSTLFWQGDQMVNWGQHDGLPSAVTGLLSGGLSGFSLNHSDIGGYASVDFPVGEKIKRSSELLDRWMQLAAFTPVFRTHEGLGPAKNHQVYSDSITIAKFAYYARVHQAWKAYRNVLLDEAAALGWPLVRPMAFVFPDDMECWKLSQQQFMLGNELLVVPVLTPASNHIEYYLPQGTWVNTWDGTRRVSKGEWFKEGGYAYHPGVFYPEGSKVGMDLYERLKDLGFPPHLP